MTIWRGRRRTSSQISPARQVIYHLANGLAAFQRGRQWTQNKNTQRAGTLFSAARRAKLTSTAKLVGRGPVIVLAPHPDDETLGCGGLLASCADARIPAFVFIMTDGTLSHPGHGRSANTLSRLRTMETIGALRALGLSASVLRTCGLSDGRALLDREGMARAAARIGTFARNINATALFTTWRHDPHPDHMAAALLAARVQDATPRLRIFHYPVRGRFLPDNLRLPEMWRPFRLSIGPYVARKRRAMAAYRSQTSPLVATPLVAFRFHRDEVKAYTGPAEFFFEERR